MTGTQTVRPPKAFNYLKALTRRGASIGPLALANGISVANSLGIALLYARLAGPGPFGIYQMTLGLTALAGVVCLSGSSTAATRAAAQGRVAAWPLFVFRLPYTLGGAILLAGAAGCVAFAGSSALAAAMLAAAVTLPLYYGADVFPAHLLGVRDYPAFLRYQAVVQTVTLAALAVAVVAAPAKPWLAVLAVAAPTGVIQLVGLVSLRRHASHDAGDLSYARRLTGISVLSAVDARLDVLLAGAFLGTRDAGFVAVARTLPLAVKRLWEVLYQAFFAKMASVSKAEATRLATQYRTPLMVLLGVVLGAIIVAAPYVVPGLFGEEFDRSVVLTQLLALAGIVVLPGRLYEVVMKSHGEVRSLAVIYTVLPLVSLVALPPLVVSLGLVGIGVEALLAAVVYLLLIRRCRRAESLAEPGS